MDLSFISAICSQPIRTDDEQQKADLNRPSSVSVHLPTGPTLISMNWHDGSNRKVEAYAISWWFSQWLSYKTVSWRFSLYRFTKTIHLSVDNYRRTVSSPVKFSSHFDNFRMSDVVFVNVCPFCTTICPNDWHSYHRSDRQRLTFNRDWIIQNMWIRRTCMWTNVIGVNHQCSVHLSFDSVMLREFLWEQITDFIHMHEFINKKNQGIWVIQNDNQTILRHKSNSRQ